MNVKKKKKAISFRSEQYARNRQQSFKKENISSIAIYRSIQASGSLRSIEKGASVDICRRKTLVDGKIYSAKVLLDAEKKKKKTEKDKKKERREKKKGKKLVRENSNYRETGARFELIAPRNDTTFFYL